MHEAHELLRAIAVVLCVAAVTTVLFQKVRQPVVLGYILAGLIVGPHVPVPLLADRGIVQALSELGVILLMFALGLEFSLRKLAEVGPTAGLTAVIQSTVMLWLGFLLARAFGWTSLESLFVGAAMAISSTTIIAKAFEEQNIRGRVRDLVVGILIVEDLVAILMMAILTALASGQGLSASTVLRSGGRLSAFLAGLLAVGLLLVPRAIRGILRLKRPETTLVASVGVCFAIALLAQEFGYSVALGAFIAGSLVAESGEAREIEHLVVPVRDLFAAIFFVSVGMLIDPGVVLRHSGAVAAFSVLVVAGKVVAVSLGSFLTGNGPRTSIQSGMSLAQIGEFSFIISGLGVSLGATRSFIYPIAVAVSAITTLVTPLLIRAAGPAASYVDRTLPRGLQTFTALYGSWLESLRTAGEHPSLGRKVTRLAGLAALDASLLVAVVIGTRLATQQLPGALSVKLGVSPELAKTALLAGGTAAALPLALGIVRMSGRLGRELAIAALPESAAGAVDLGAAPRRALLVTLQLSVLFVVGAPVLALTQPFVPGWVSLGVLGGSVVVFGWIFWRAAENLQGHVKAGASMIVEALLRQAREPRLSPAEEALREVRHWMPGLGSPSPVRLEEGSPSVGKTLAQLNLRGVTGASVLAMVRGDQGVTIPNADEVLRPGDVLAIAGTRDAVMHAKELLGGGAVSESPQA